MRWQNGIGGHAAVRPSMEALWTFDETAVPTRDSISALVASPTGSVSVISAPTTRARRYDGFSFSQSTPSAAHTSAMQAPHTVGVLLRITERIIPSNTLAAFRDGADSYFLLRTSATGELTMVWTGQSLVNTVVIPNVPFGEWVYLSWSWANYSGLLGDLTIYLNGMPVATATSAQKPRGVGTTGRWTFGAEDNGSRRARVDIAGAYLWSEPLIQDAHARDLMRMKCLLGPTTVCARLEIENEDGDRVDMGNLAETDWLQEVRIADSLDDQAATCDITLLRQIGNLSLAPQKTESMLNLKDFSDLNSYAPLLQPGRAMEVFVQRVPHGLKPIDADWWSAFEGCIEDVNPGGDDTIELQAIDRAGELTNIPIEQEVRNTRIDGDVVDEPERQASYGRLRDDTAVRPAGQWPVFVSVDPAVPAANPGGGQAARDAIQCILNDNDAETANNTSPSFAYTDRPGSYDPFEVYEPTDVEWALVPWRQRKEPVMAAIQKIAQQAAATLRYEFVFNVDTGTEGWFLTLRRPLKERDDVNMHALPCEVIDVGNWNISNRDVRNVVRVVYQTTEQGVLPPLPPNPDTGAPISPGVPFVAFGTNYVARNGWYDVNGETDRQVAFITIENLDSLAAYKRRFMELTNASGDQIDELGQAFEFCFQILRDLELPEAGVSVTFPAIPELTWNDVINFGPNPVIHTGDQRLTVYRVQTTISADRATTEVELRGRPSVGYRKWQDIEAWPGNGPPPVIDPHDALTDTQDARTQGWIRQMVDKANRDNFGKYLSIENPGFDVMTAGRDLPPDGWHVEEPAIWAPAAYYFDEGLTSLPNSGHRSLKMAQDPDGRIYNKMVPIDGESFSPIDPGTPYAVEVVWKRTAAQIDPTFEGLAVHLDWYSDNKNVGIQPDYTVPGDGHVAPTNFLGRTVVTFHNNGDGSVPVGWVKERNEGELIDAWFDGNPIQSNTLAAAAPTAHKEGIIPAPGARFVRVSLCQAAGGAGTEQMLVDFVSVYKKARETKAVNDNVGGQTVGVGATGVLVEFDSVEIADGGFDHGNNFNTGLHRFVARESGIYRVAASLSLQKTTGMLSGPQSASIDVFRNGIAYERGQTGHANTGIFCRANIVSHVRLERGDFVDIRVNMIAGVGGYTVRTLPDESYFHVKLQQNE